MYGRREFRSSNYGPRDGDRDGRRDRNGNLFYLLLFFSLSINITFYENLLLIIIIILIHTICFRSQKEIRR